MASGLTPDDVGKMKVAELRAELKARDLSTTGLKKELADRLLEHLSSSGGASNGADAAQAPSEAAAAPDAGTDVSDTAAPSGDSTAQTAAEAAPILTSTEQADTLDLPSEMPAIPPVTEDSVDDFTGAEGTIAQETATEGVETVNEPSAVHRPPPDHLDKTPGFVADSRVEEAREKAEVVPLNEPAVLPSDEEASRKRKHDEVADPVMSAPESAVPSVAEQAETSAPPNDEITADPAASSILNGSEPETKRARTDVDDIPVPQTVDVEEVSSMPVDAKTNGASSSTFPTSVIPPGGASGQNGGLSDTGPDVVPLNEPQKPATDFASADMGEATAIDAAAKTATGGAEEETKSVPALFHDTRNSSSSSPLPAPLPSAHLAPKTHYVNSTGSNSEKRDKSAQGDASSTIPSTQSFKIRGLSSNTLSNTTSPNINHQIQNSVARNPSSSSSPMSIKNPVSNSKSTDQSNQSQKPPLSNSICISNLVRPFTLPALKSKLEDYGDYEFFWINSIKSHCFVTYTSTDSAEQACSNIEGEIWPEAVGKPLSVTYIPSEKIPSLVEKEEAAGRTRLELVTTFDEASSEWQYDVIAPATSSGKTLGHAPSVPRGLASSMPLQARAAGIAAPGPFGPGGRLDPRNMITATSASGAPIQLPSNSAFAQSRPPVSIRQTGPASSTPLLPPSAAPRDSDRTWTPKADAVALYSKTNTAPQLYYKAVDKVAAGRRLRQLEVGPKSFERGPYNRGNGSSRPATSTSYRDSYRP